MSATTAGTTPLLQTVALQRTFGGLQAVRSVDFLLQQGEIRAIIGPNGAGKTTLLNLICGRISPTSGRVLYKGADITAVAPHDRVRLGVAYTFQLISIFRALSVYENVALAARRRLMRSPLGHLVVDPRHLDARVGAVLAAVGLADSGAALAGSLPYGHQRLVEVAMALALEPEILALDEPTQGLAPDEIARLVTLIRTISQTATILLVEHNMAVVLEVSRRITVMDKGSIIAEGTPAEIEANPEVQRVYLGG